MKTLFYLTEENEPPLEGAVLIHEGCVYREDLEEWSERKYLWQHKETEMNWPDGRPRYRIGQRWRCNRDYDRFEFEIIEKADPGKKVCKLICIEPECKEYDHRRCFHGTSQEYSHKHLKKHAHLIYDPVHGDIE